MTLSWAILSAQAAQTPIMMVAARPRVTSSRSCTTSAMSPAKCYAKSQKREEVREPRKRQWSSGKNLSFCLRTNLGLLQNISSNHGQCLLQQSTCGHNLRMHQLCAPHHQPLVGG
jgi:hypothetical protein